MNYSPRTMMLLSLSSLLLLLYFIMPTSLLYARENTIIKVGYPIVRNFTDKKDGLYTGYVYDYLREIAIYTGWEYEFIEMDLEDAMEALTKGEIDLVAGILKNEQSDQLFEFPNFDIGFTYTTLSTLEDSPYWAQPNYVVLDNIRVGYYETSSSRLTHFMDFCRNNGIKDITLVPYPHSKDREFLVDKLRTKEVDAIIGNDLSILAEEKVLARFGATRHFLATTKGNMDLVNALDKARGQIAKRNPEFEETLYTKYFENDEHTTLILSREQSTYLKTLAPIKAVYISNYIPAQYYDPITQEAKGELIEVVRLLGKRLGIIFDFIPVTTYEEAYEMIELQQADVVIGIADDYLNADKHDLMLTPHYCKIGLTKVVNVHQTPKETEVLALPKGHVPIKQVGDYELRYYDTIEECLQAVNSGQVYATYINADAISHYLSNNQYSHIAVLPGTQEIGISLGLSKHLDPTLTEILHKAVYYLPSDDTSNQAAHTYQVKRPFNLKNFFYNNISFCLGFLCFLLIFMAIHIRLLVFQTKIDALTGIFNRRACEKYISKYLSMKKSSRYVAFIIIDIDHFKQVNDHFGHKMGDALLIEFSKVLKKTFSRGALSFRLGGDEFTVFIKNVPPQATYKVSEKLEKLCHTMHKTIEHNGQSQEISLSVGAILTNSSLSFNELYTAADEMLYEVKRNGRNNYKIREYL